MLGNAKARDCYYWIGKIVTPRGMHWKMTTAWKKVPLERADYIEIGKRYKHAA